MKEVAVDELPKLTLDNWRGAQSFVDAPQGALNQELWNHPLFLWSHVMHYGKGFTAKHFSIPFSHIVSAIVPHLQALVTRMWTLCIPYRPASVSDLNMHPLRWLCGPQ